MKIEEPKSHWVGRRRGVIQDIMQASETLEAQFLSKLAGHTHEVSSADAIWRATHFLATQEWDEGKKETPTLQLPEQLADALIKGTSAAVKELDRRIVKDAGSKTR